MVQVVLRFDVAIIYAAPDPRSNLTVKRVDEFLAQLPSLETVTVESPNVRDARPLRGEFKLTGHKLRFRTLEDARKIAALAREKRELPASEDQVVSPFWYLLRHKYQWKYW